MVDTTETRNMTACNLLVMGRVVDTREFSVELVTTGVEVADTVDVDVEMDVELVVVDVKLTVVVELLPWSY